MSTSAPFLSRPRPSKIKIALIGVLVQAAIVAAIWPVAAHFRAEDAEREKAVQAAKGLKTNETMRHPKDCRWDGAPR